MNTPNKKSQHPSLNTTSTHHIQQTNKPNLHSSKNLSRSPAKHINRNKSEALISTWKLFILPQFREKQYKDNYSKQKNQQHEKMKKPPIIKFKNNFFSRQQTTTPELDIKYKGLKFSRNSGEQSNSLTHMYLKEEAEYLRKSVITFFDKRYNYPR